MTGFQNDGDEYAAHDQADRDAAADIIAAEQENMFPRHATVAAAFVHARRLVEDGEGDLLVIVPNGLNLPGEQADSDGDSTEIVTTVPAVWLADDPSVINRDGIAKAVHEANERTRRENAERIENGDSRMVEWPEVAAQYDAEHAKDAGDPGDSWPETTQKWARNAARLLRGRMLEPLDGFPLTDPEWRMLSRLGWNDSESSQILAGLLGRLRSEAYEDGRVAGRDEYYNSQD